MKVQKQISNKEMGKKIDEAIKKKRITKESLAEKMGVQPRTIYTWTSGRSWPRGGGIVKLADILCIQFEYLTVEENTTETTTETTKEATKTDHCYNMSNEFDKLRILEMCLPLVNPLVAADFFQRINNGLHTDNTYIDKQLHVLWSNISDVALKQYIAAEIKKMNNRISQGYQPEYSEMYEIKSEQFWRKSQNLYFGLNYFKATT